MNRLRNSAAAVAVAALAGMAGLAGCSGGNSVEGTYFGTAGDTVLILSRGGECAYTEDYDEAEGVKIEAGDDCTWSISGDNVTFTYTTENPNLSLRRQRAVTGLVGDDGTLSFPDQEHWSGEIYTKK